MYILKKIPLIVLGAQIDTNTMIVEDLNTPLSPTDRSSRQRSTNKFESCSTH
jgi:hypothetical protein